MPTLELDGREIYYEEHGAGEPLLGVMGLAADTLAWALQVQPFSERHRTVIFDNRDVGRSSRADADYAVVDMAADALALADALELERFHLLGVSMGGAIAQEIALAAPDRVQTLTLAVTFASGSAYGAKLAEVWGARVQKLTREERVDELLLLTLSEGRRRRRVAAPAVACEGRGGAVATAPGGPWGHLAGAARSGSTE